MHTALLNGQPASADDLRALALTNYGHYSSMRVSNGAVQGLELHERRLQTGTLELFDSALDFAIVREHMRAAVAATPDCTLRATVFSRSFDYRKPAGSFAAEVLISLSPPAPSSERTLRVKSFEFQRPLPHIKHVGTFPLFHYRRHALGQGYDDALFVDAVDRGEPGNSQIITYRFHEANSAIHAIMRNKKTGAISVYEMDVVTKTPHIVSGIRVKRNKTRPRVSREFKIWLASKRWEDKDET